MAAGSDGMQTCSLLLQAQGKAYPRTCQKCGLGPCFHEATPGIPLPAPLPAGYAWVLLDAARLLRQYAPKVNLHAMDVIGRLEEIATRHERHL